MKVEILYVAGCPHAQPAREAVECALREAHVRANVQAVLVNEQNAGRTAGFAGSPTVLINGRDVEPAQSAGLSCRIYAGGKGYPSQDVVRRAVERAMAEGETE